MKRFLCALTTAFLAAAIPALGQTVNGVAQTRDGVPIYYTTIGEGETAIVFVHGWTLDGTFWDEQVGYFAENRQVVALDLAGHGKSGKDRAYWSMAAFGDDVVAVVSELQLERVVLVGHSMGGRVILDAAQQLGGRVAGLVFVDSFFDPEEMILREQRQQIVNLYRTDFAGNVGMMARQYLFAATSDSLLKERIANHMASFDPEIGVASIEELFGTEYKDVIMNLDVPKIAINADRYPTYFERMHEYGVQPYIMESVGHFLMLEDPATFNQVLEEALHDFVEK